MKRATGSLLAWWPNWRHSMLTWFAVLVVAILAIFIGFFVGRCRWPTNYQGYGVLIVLIPLATALGFPIGEILIDCIGFAAGFYRARI